MEKKTIRFKTSTFSHVTASEGERFSLPVRRFSPPSYRRSFCSGRRVCPPACCDWPLGAVTARFFVRGARGPGHSASPRSSRLTHSVNAAQSSVRLRRSALELPTTTLLFPSFLVRCRWVIPISPTARSRRQVSTTVGLSRHPIRSRSSFAYDSDADRRRHRTTPPPSAADTAEAERCPANYLYLRIRIPRRRPASHVGR